jgi:hypothetical protein
MIQIKNVEVTGIERALRASGNVFTVGEINTTEFFEPNDSERGMRYGSVESGKGYDHFLSGITVVFDIKYPQYWISEAQRYHWFNIISTQSLGQRLMYITNKKEFNSLFNKYVESEIIEKIKMYVDAYNIAVEKGDSSQEWLMRAVSNLPMGFEMWMTVSTNYLQLKTMYLQRRTNKFEEDWGNFIKFCEELPKFLELIGEKKIK